MRRICEACEHGYAPELEQCPWCGASAAFSHTSDITATMDTECYPDYWLCMFDSGEVFQTFPGYPLDVAGLRRTLSTRRVVTFNGQNYDMPMIAIALATGDTRRLKWASDQITGNGVKHWDLLRDLGIAPLEWVDHIDLFDVAPGQGSLKIYGAKMHSKRLQDLPISPDSNIEWYDRVRLRDYCANDLATTRDLFNTFPTQIALREDMGREYGVELRSKSDAQIAEAVMKAILPFRVERPSIPAGTQFNYVPPDWLVFQTDTMRRVLAIMSMSRFAVNPKGGVSPGIDNHLVDWGKDQERLDAHGQFVSKPADWTYTTVQIGASSYAMGIGGLHSTEHQVTQTADEWHELTDHDVASYYPSLIIRTGIYPRQIGEVFQSTYSGWYYRRIEAKHAGIKKVANSLKTLLNGTFGKLGSKYSIFYAPSEMIQVTVTGQLALLMLIEALELAGIPVVSANTDGIVVRCPRALTWMRDDIIRWWESVTQFETERADYLFLASRDVNTYVADKLDGDVKLKGEFAPAEPGASGWPNPTGQICVDAMIAFMTKGVPLADTIRPCRDIRKFIYATSVTGGASYHEGGVVEKTVPKKTMIEVAGSVEEYAALRERQVATGEYLGKAVRWYYATGTKGSIARSKTGNKVSRATGVRPLMELPDVFPDDVDYDWYITEAQSLIESTGWRLP